MRNSFCFNTFKHWEEELKCNPHPTQQLGNQHRPPLHKETLRSKTTSINPAPLRRSPHTQETDVLVASSIWLVIRSTSRAACLGESRNRSASKIEPPVNASYQGCEIKAFSPTSVIQGESLLHMEALFVVSRKWSFPTALHPMDGRKPPVDRWFVPLFMGVCPIY